MRDLLLLALLLLLQLGCSSGRTTGTEQGAGSARPTDFPERGVTEQVRKEAPAHLGAETRDWRTDWSRTRIDLAELMSGGPPRDGIPPIDHPRFLSLQEAADHYGEEEPVVVYVQGEEARAYPLAILIWHEIVNDEVGGRPLTLTFCPLCNTAIAFDRRLDGRRLDFGTSGLLRHSDLVMWDRQTESLWQQVTGEAIVGELAGARLDLLPTRLLSLSEFRQAYPEGLVLSPETGFDRPYGTNPYPGYDGSSRPFLFRGEVDERLPALERVVGVAAGQEAVAYPFSALREHPVVNDEIDGRPIVIFYSPATLSPLDASEIASSRPSGSAVAYIPVVRGERLTFERRGEAILDRETGSRWNMAGVAEQGKLAGSSLEIFPHANHFWFAFTAFYPDAALWAPRAP